MPGRGARERRERLQRAHRAREERLGQEMFEERLRETQEALGVFIAFADSVNVTATGLAELAPVIERADPVSGRLVRGAALRLLEELHQLQQLGADWPVEGP